MTPTQAAAIVYGNKPTAASILQAARAVVATAIAQGWRFSVTGKVLQTPHSALL